MRTILAAFAFVAVTACSSSSLFSSDAAPDQQWALVQNHVYIDHLPKNERDMVRHLAFIVHEDAGKIGLRGQASRFRMFNDLLRWQRNGNRISSKVLQTGDEVKATFRAWKCKGEAPAPLDLCLELKEGDRTMRYYSNHDWIIESQGQLDAAVAKIPLDG